MKQTLFLLLIYTTLCGCNNGGQTQEDSNTLFQEHALEDTIKLLQPSQLSFDDALNDVKAAKKTEASVILKKAVLQLRTEKENMKIPDVKEKMEHVTDNIEAIADSLEDGRNINTPYLRKNISKAELLLARYYFINTDMPGKIDKTYVAMDKTVDLMEAGLRHNDDAKISADAGTLLSDTRDLIKKTKNSKEQHKEELKKQGEKIKAFLEKSTN